MSPIAEKDRVNSDKQNVQKILKEIYKNDPDTTFLDCDHKQLVDEDVELILKALEENKGNGKSFS